MMNNHYSEAASTALSPYRPTSYGPAPYSKAWIASTKVNGVAGCMTWVPDNKRTVNTRNNYTETTNYTHQPVTLRAYDAQHAMTSDNYYDTQRIANNITTQATQTTVRDGVLAQAVDEGFEQAVREAVHTDSNLRRTNEYNGYAPKPPAGKPSSTPHSRKYSYVNNRRVLIADPSGDSGRSSRTGRSWSPPQDQTLVVVRPNTGYSRSRGEVTPCDHHVIESQHSSLGGRSRSCLHLPQQNSYDFNAHEQLNYTDGSYHSDDKLREYQLGVGYDVTRQHQQELVRLREAAAEERKKLLGIYQKVKSDEKFYGPVPWQKNWHRMTSSGATTESEATEQAVALADSQERLHQLLDKREQLQRQYIRNQQMVRSLSSSSLRGSGAGSRCSSPHRGVLDTVNGNSFNDRSISSTGQKYVTVYNPGRSTPVGSYYATDSNRPLTSYHYHTRSLGGQQQQRLLGDEANQVNVKVDCQPNTDTVLSLRVRSCQV